MLGGIKKRGTAGADNDGESGRSGGSDSAVDLQGDTPEAVAARAVVRLCARGEKHTFGARHKRTSQADHALNRKLSANREAPVNKM